MHALLASASLGQSLSSFFDAVGQFFSDLEAVHWGLLLLGLAFFGLNLTLRSRAFFHSLRAAYPASASSGGGSGAPTSRRSASTTSCRRAVAMSSSCSSRAPRSPGSSYPTVAAAFFVESVFDVTVGVLVLIFAFTQGVFPKPPDFSKLNSFDISYLAEHFRLTLFLITALAVLALVAFALLSVRVKAFWARVRQGVTILERSSSLPARGRSLAGGAHGCAVSPPSGSCSKRSAWAARCENVLLVFAVNQVAGAVPFTPGGAGVQQALLVKVFADSAPTTVVAAYSVGQQIAIAIFTALVGLGAVVFIFRFRSFKEVLYAGRASRDAEREAERAGVLQSERDDWLDEDPPLDDDPAARRAPLRHRRR